MVIPDINVRNNDNNLFTVYFIPLSLTTYLRPHNRSCHGTKIIPPTSMERHSCLLCTVHFRLKVLADGWNQVCVGSEGSSNGSVHTPNGWEGSLNGSVHTPNGWEGSLNGSVHTPNGWEGSSHGSVHTPNGWEGSSHGSVHTPHGWEGSSNGSVHIPNGWDGSSRGSVHTPNG